jgi:hypothetical protein
VLQTERAGRKTEKHKFVEPEVVRREIVLTPLHLDSIA